MTLAFPKLSLGRHCPVLPTCFLIQISLYQPMGTTVKKSSWYRGTIRKWMAHTQIIHVLYADTFSVCGCAQMCILHGCTPTTHTQTLRVITNPLMHLNLELFWQPMLFITDLYDSPMREINHDWGRQKRRKWVWQTMHECVSTPFQLSRTVHRTSWKCRFLFLHMAQSQEYVAIFHSNCTTNGQTKTGQRTLLWWLRVFQKPSRDYVNVFKDAHQNSQGHSDKYDEKHRKAS